MFSVLEARKAKEPVLRDTVDEFITTKQGSYPSEPV